ncbi:MAG: family 10 glycosylhydrolase [Thermoguttaceae bacterium]|nr:family 10 glycosylhydrolase [Thermoguttaceae bacterium]
MMLRRLALPLLLLISSALFAEEMFRDALILNEDNSHFFGTRSSEEMSVEGLNAFVDQYAGTAVTHIFFCVNASRANVVNPAREAIWEPNRDGVEPTDGWPANAKLLNDRGIDPYTVWIDRCREKNISPWCSVRTNDLHHLDDLSNFQHSSFVLEHPQFWRVPNDTGGKLTDRALNFRHPEVRKHLTDFIDFLFERYDFDGIELDWMRFGWHLTPGHEREEAPFLTEVVEHTHEAAVAWSAKRGHKIGVAVRVPAVPEAAAGLGMDAVDWAKKGLVDLIVPCAFFYSMDFNVPFEDWKEAIAGTDVSLAAASELIIASFPGATETLCTIDQLHGFAAEEKFRGAANIYLFNWMDSETLPVSEDQYRQMLRDGFSDTFLASCPREVPLTFHDTVPPGMSNAAQLPKITDKPVKLVIPTGPPPAGETGKIFVGLAEERNLGSFRGILNGAEPIESQIVKPSDLPGAKSTLIFTFPRELFAEGNNTFTLTQVNGESSVVVYVKARFD